MMDCEVVKHKILSITSIGAILDIGLNSYIIKGQVSGILIVIFCSVGFVCLFDFRFRFTEFVCYGFYMMQAGG